VPAKRPILIKDLLTHTAGINYGTSPEVASQYEAKGLGPAAGYGWYFADKDEPICVSMERLGTLPFVAQPGDAYVYGYTTDILGCIGEKASGVPLDEFIRSHEGSFERKVNECYRLESKKYFITQMERRFALPVSSCRTMLEDALRPVPKSWDQMASPQ
jgi:hypothetical protein